MLTFLLVTMMFASVLADVPVRIAGEQGPKGLPGAPSTVLGPKGPLGTVGELGIQGEPGDKGEQGEQGTPGSKGEVGEKGDPSTTKGEKGKVGISGPFSPGSTTDADLYVCAGESDYHNEYDTTTNPVIGSHSIGFGFGLESSTGDLPTQTGLLVFDCDTTTYANACSEMGVGSQGTYWLSTTSTSYRFTADAAAETTSSYVPFEDPTQGGVFWVGFDANAGGVGHLQTDSVLIYNTPPNCDDVCGTADAEGCVCQRGRCLSRCEAPATPAPPTPAPTPQPTTMLCALGDECECAVPISGDYAATTVAATSGATISGDLTIATFGARTTQICDEENTTAIGDLSENADLWYFLTAAADEYWITVTDTSGSGNDLFIQVYEQIADEDCSQFVCTGRIFQDADAQNPCAWFSGVAGRNYYIRVSTYDNAGTFDLAVFSTQQTGCPAAA